MLLNRIIYYGNILEFYETLKTERESTGYFY